MTKDKIFGLIAFLISIPFVFFYVEVETSSFFVRAMSIIWWINIVGCFLGHLNSKLLCRKTIIVLSLLIIIAVLESYNY